MELARFRKPIALVALEAQLVVRRVDRLGSVLQSVARPADADGLYLLCPWCVAGSRHKLPVWTWKVPADVSPGPVRYCLLGDVGSLSIVGDTDVILSKACGGTFTVRLGAAHLLTRAGRAQS